MPREVAKSQQTLFWFLNLSHAHILGKESCEITLESGGLMVHPVNASTGIPSSAWAPKHPLAGPISMGVKWTPPAVATGWYAKLQITKLQENSARFWEYSYLWTLLSTWASLVRECVSTSSEHSRCTGWAPGTLQTATPSTHLQSTVKWAQASPELSTSSEMSRNHVHKETFILSGERL